ncbi:hypothetical protein [Caudoviricetes sp.]|nr:hypothetical protein [Caudoviricetes sp.]UOF79158.1 hypothetical protein [Caudoviricetes sp.]
MANTSRPSGFKPFREILQVTPYVAHEAIYPGDPVKLQGGNASTSQLNAEVALAAAGNAIMGIAASYQGTAGGEVLVYDHPNQLFIAEVNSSDIDSNLDLGLTIDFVASSPSTTYKQSRAVLAGATTGTTTYPFRLLGIVRSVDNALGANVKAIVSVNNHQLKGGTGTASV